MVFNSLDIIFYSLPVFIDDCRYADYDCYTKPYGQCTLCAKQPGKQEANQIDNELEIHENELERQYRDGTLTRDEFRTNERELDHLEDLLDAAEDQLEYVFGIDD